jgi:4-hydroxy-4-methyl-2-oxoglutarate aldolase
VLIVGIGNSVVGYCGEVLAVATEAAGVVGLVIDSGARDVIALAARSGASCA